jgi:hypothetical protein
LYCCVYLSYITLTLEEMLDFYLLNIPCQLLAVDNNATYYLSRHYAPRKVKIVLLLGLFLLSIINKSYGGAQDSYQQNHNQPLKESSSSRSASKYSCSTSLSVVTTNAACGNGGTINLTVQGGTAPFTYQWTGPNSFTAATKDLSGLPAGTYAVTVTDATQCIATITATITATIDTTPPIIVATGFTTELTNGSRTIEAADIDYGSYDDCSGIAAMSISPSMFTCANVGPNFVTITVTDGAGNAATQTVIVVVKADATCTPLATSASFADEGHLRAYPNPATVQATVSFQPDQTGPAQVLAYNALGQLVATLYDGPVLAKKQYSLTWDSRSLDSGIYFCQLRTANGTQVVPLLIVK